MTLPTDLALAAENGRICPKPPRWAKLYELLPNSRRDGYGYIPAAPLILGAWWETGEEQKISRLREHLESANEQGALDRVHQFLAALPESEWHHAGE